VIADEHLAWHDGRALRVRRLDPGITEIGRCTMAAFGARANNHQLKIICPSPKKPDLHVNRN
jgi:hypothetical protein